MATWVLVLHISALLMWCAALLYLPVLIIGITDERVDLHKTHRPAHTVERLVFTHLATPAALIAIIAGTVVFVFNRTIDGWLIAKLTLVVGLVVCHTLTGLLVLKTTGRTEESGEDMPLNSKSVTVQCVLLELTQGILILAILWTVLAKPSVGTLP